MKKPNDDSSYPPPPHDSPGHTWHHPDRVLIEIIRDGSDFPQSRMPTFGDKLTDDDTEAIIEFSKDNWGSEEREYQKQVTDQDQGQSLGPPRKIPTVTSRGNRATYGGRRNHERLR